MSIFEELRLLVEIDWPTPSGPYIAIIRDGLAGKYIYRIEHAEITGHTFPNIAINRDIVYEVSRVVHINKAYTRAHLRSFGINT